MTILISLILLLIIGAFAGLMAGLLGVGGGIILVPAFYFASNYLGYDNSEIYHICLATSLATIIVTSLRSVLTHHKAGAVEWQILRDWGGFIAIGAILGVAFILSRPYQFLVISFGCLGIIIGLYMAFGRPEWRLGKQMPAMRGGVIFGPIIGFLSTLMGIGGGSFGVPLMTLHNVPIHRAVATAAGFGVIIALPPVLILAFWVSPADSAGIPPFTLGYVNVVAFFVVISMTLITAPMGARLAHRLNPKPLRWIFAGFLIIVASWMLIEGYYFPDLMS